MKTSHAPSSARGIATRLLLSTVLCSALVFAWVAQSLAASGQPSGSSLPEQTGAAGTLTVSATLEQCASTGEQIDRSATFAGDMTALSGTAKMEMRIEVQERMPGEGLFHTVTAPGLGVWRGSAPGVKIYQYVKQVTNLSSPAEYRALIRFHWLDEKGRVTRRAARFTAKCDQPARLFAPAPTSTPSGSTGLSSSPPARA